MDTGQERIEDDETIAGEMEGPDKTCGGQVWDIHGDYEQMEAFNFAIKSSCELGFEKVSNIITHGGNFHYFHGKL